MSSELITIFLLSLASMANPTLIAALTVMLLLPNPKRLMLGYLLGAYLTSITIGLLIVFTLSGSNAGSGGKHTVGPVEDLIVATLALTVAWILRTGRDRPFEERRRAKKEVKLEARREAGKPTESLPLRLLGKGNPWVTFLVGAALSFPGVSYLAALDQMHKLHASTGVTVLLVVGFCLVELLLLEVPLLGYAFAPERTEKMVSGFRSWIQRSGRTAVVIGATVIGVWLLIRAVLALL